MAFYSGVEQEERERKSLPCLAGETQVPSTTSLSSNSSVTPGVEGLTPEVEGVVPGVSKKWGVELVGLIERIKN